MIRSTQLRDETVKRSRAPAQLDPLTRSARANELQACAKITELRMPGRLRRADRIGMEYKRRCKVEREFFGSAVCNCDTRGCVPIQLKA
jgi:hypothetical protein